ncbi:MAG: 30S ribosomal protein S18 [Candidatus Pacebacteria bacterium]|nr:30S ribosomal protein S18 [Candidatus Paceibacterota bacterium]
MAARKKRIRLPRIAKISSEHRFSYKRIGELRRYITEQGYIYSRKVTNLTQKQQKSLRTAIQRARALALLPYTQTL